MRHLSKKLLTIVLTVMMLSLFGVGRSGNSLARETAAGQAESKPGLQTQQQNKPKEQEPQDDKPITLGTDLVVLDVTVVDSSNRPVMDLTRENFLITEDKAQQKIDFFSREQVPVSLVFAIDTSGSMRLKIDTVIKASINLVKESRPGDEIAIIDFKDQPELLEEFTTDTEDVIYTLQGLIASRQTAMLDALYLSADYASKEGKNRRKAVVLVTDGLDKDSYYKFGEVVDHLRETDVQVYLIGFISDLEGGGFLSKSPKEKAQGLLTKLANETGGRAFYPLELGEMNAIAQQISNDLRTQYSIGYYPTNSKRDGTFRSVKVQITASNRRLVARTRNGYVAPRAGDRRSSTDN